MTKPVCSVCVANYNGEYLLDECLQSILKQTGDIAIEIIVHDDASTDASLALLKNYPTVIVIASDTNVGFCVANNRMARRAGGDFLLLLNNDAKLQPDAIATLHAYAAAQEKPAILTLPQFDRQSGALVDRGCMLDLFYNPIPNVSIETQSVGMAIGACLWVPVRIWDLLGGFPEWFGSIGEDLFLCSAARIAGYDVICLPQSGYQHWQGKSFGGNRAAEGISSTYRRRFLSERNKTIVLYACTPTALFSLALAIHVIALMLEGTILSAVKAEIRIWREIYFGALKSAWRLRFEIAALRRQVQRMRQVSIWTYMKTFRLWPRKLLMLVRHGLPIIKD